MSLVTFRSPTQGSVIMFGNDAQTLLTALNLPTQGEISSAELPAYQHCLQAAIDRDKAQNPIVWPEAAEDSFEPEAPLIVRFSQRVAPFMQLIERCIAATETIRW